MHVTYYTLLLKFFVLQQHWPLGNSIEKGSAHSQTSHSKKVHCFVWKDRKPVNFVKIICDDNALALTTCKIKEFEIKDYCSQRKLIDMIKGQADY